jgi:precorrin-2 dehydrogenase/sirohydrochlorin ferrochelatase
MLDVRGRRAIVVGCECIAAQKAAALAASGAIVTAIAPDFCAEFQALSGRGQVALLRKAYEPGDLAGAFIVIAAANDRELVDAVWAEAEERRQLINVVDVPDRCSFIMPSVLRRGPLSVAVSTGGASPSMAKRIRERLEDQFSPAYGAYLRLAAAARKQLRRHGVSYQRRDEFFSAYFESEVLERLEAGNKRGAKLATAKLLRRYGVPVRALARRASRGSKPCLRVGLTSVPPTLQTVQA